MKILNWKEQFNMLALAETYNLRTVAMPAISSGVLGFPKDRCAEILLHTICRFLKQPVLSLQTVTMCKFDEKTYKIFCHYLKEDSFICS